MEPHADENQTTFATTVFVVVLALDRGRKHDHLAVEVVVVADHHVFVVLADHVEMVGQEIEMQGPWLPGCRRMGDQVELDFLLMAGSLGGEAEWPGGMY